MRDKENIFRRRKACIKVCPSVPILPMSWLSFQARVRRFKIGTIIIPYLTLRSEIWCVVLIFLRINLITDLTHKQKLSYNNKKDLMES
jgi:hypothetical protein